MNDLLCAKHGTQIGNRYCQQCEAELLELAEKAVEAQKNDTRTEAEKIADAVAFILDTRVGGT